MKKKGDKEVEQVSRTCQCWLDGDSIKRMSLGEISIVMPAPGPKPEHFADEAFKRNAGSLRRLMVPYYRIVVEADDRDFSFGLDRWMKLMDGSREHEENMSRRKQPIRRGKVSA